MIKGEFMDILSMDELRLGLYSVVLSDKRYDVVKPKISVKPYKVSVIRLDVDKDDTVFFMKADVYYALQTIYEEIEGTSYCFDSNSYIIPKLKKFLVFGSKAAFLVKVYTKEEFEVEYGIKLRWE